MRPSVHAAAVLFVFVLAACQGSASPTGGGGAGQASATLIRPTATPTATGGRLSPAASSSSATGGVASPLQPTAGTTAPGSSPGTGVGFHDAADLERVVPTQAGGLPLIVESVSGSGFTDARGNHKAGLRCRWYEGRGLRCRDQKVLGSVLAALGRSPQDVTIAVGYNETADREIEVQATRVAGVNGGQVLDAVVAALRDAAAARKRTLSVSQATVGGKSVTVITYQRPYPLGLRRYLYANGDTFFDIRRAYDAPAAEILQALP